MVDKLTVYQFITRHIPDHDAEPGLASYAYGSGHILAWVHGPNIALCAEEPDVMSKRLARERGRELAERRGVRWLG